eukprot:COSAG06_NODE_12964_length_1308_cov_0.797353_2_plen_28_part_01
MRLIAAVRQDLDRQQASWHGRGYVVVVA